MTYDLTSKVIQGRKVENRYIGSKIYIIYIKRLNFYIVVFNFIPLLKVSW